MYKPDFPYLGNQVIITSGRVVNHSYDDFIFLFGKKGVAISSPATFTVDAQERTIIASPKIELGYQAETKGEPLLRGASTVLQLGQLLDAITAMGDKLKQFSAEQPENIASQIVKEAVVLAGIAKQVKIQLNSPTCLSQNTYTK